MTIAQEDGTVKKKNADFIYEERKQETGDRRKIFFDADKCRKSDFVIANVLMKQSFGKNYG